MDGPPYHGYTKKKNVLIGTSYLILASSMLISDDLVSVAFPPPCPSPPFIPHSFNLSRFVYFYRFFTCFANILYVFIRHKYMNEFTSFRRVFFFGVHNV